MLRFCEIRQYAYSAISSRKTKYFFENYKSRVIILNVRNNNWRRRVIKFRFRIKIFYVPDYVVLAATSV